MDSLNEQFIALDGVVFLVFLSWIYNITVNYGKLPLPPGPRGLPILGNLLQLPKEQEWLKYKKWAEQFGRITYLSNLGTPTLVCNTLESARELLDERGWNTGHRSVPVMNELFGIDWVITNSVDKHHRARRNLAFRYFSGPASVKHQFHQAEEAHILLLNLLRSPYKVANHLKQYSASAILLGTYGYRVKSADDPLIDEMEATVRLIQKLWDPITFLIELFPPLKHYPRWLPCSTFRHVADEVRQAFSDVRVNPYERAKRMISDGTAAPSFISSALDDLESKPMPHRRKAAIEEIIKDSAGSMFGAAMHSTVVTIHSFLLACSLSPQAVKRAQEELDSICMQPGDEHLPTFYERGQLPYVQALILEVLRWNNLTPFALPHRVVKEDVYKGMRIPAGATISANLWLIFHDPLLFPDPHSFRPERFLGDQGKEARDAMNSTWGFGQRACPGRQFAEASLFIVMSSILACFDITPSQSATTPSSPSGVKWGSGMIRVPEAFELMIKPRSETIQELIEKATDHLNL